MNKDPQKEKSYRLGLGDSRSRVAILQSSDERFVRGAKLVKVRLNMNKKYTAQKIREMEAIVASGDVGPMTCEIVAKMLRQAAEMRERCEELKAQCLKICGRETCDHNGDKCVCCARDVIDFIVRGDEETATVATHRDGANDAGKPDLSVSQMAL